MVGKKRRRVRSFEVVVSPRRQESGATWMPVAAEIGGRCLGTWHYGVRVILGVDSPSLVEEILDAQRELSERLQAGLLEGEVLGSVFDVGEHSLRLSVLGRETHLLAGACANGDVTDLDAVFPGYVIVETQAALVTISEVGPDPSDLSSFVREFSADPTISGPFRDRWLATEAGELPREAWSRFRGILSARHS